MGPEIPTTDVTPMSKPTPQRFENQVAGPITGTRSGSVLKAHKHSSQLQRKHKKQRCPGSTEPHVRPVLVRNLDQSRKKTLRYVVAYKVKNLPSSSVCQERLMQLHEFAETHKTPPPIIFQSDGRSDSSLACFVKQWKSNDIVSA